MKMLTLDSILARPRKLREINIQPEEKPQDIVLTNTTA